MTKVYTAGRPPWYDSKGTIKEPFIIGVAGGSGGGKTTVCTAITRDVGLEWVSLVSLDSFYRCLSAEEKKNTSEFNFDHPTAFDWELLIETLQQLKAGKSVHAPVYDFKTHSRSTTQVKRIYGADVIIVEGIYVLYEERLRSYLDMKVFVDTSDDIRLARRLRRDIVERGRDIEGVLTQYEKFVKPAYDDYIEPTKQFADVIIPNGADNKVGIRLIATHVKNQLMIRGWEPLEKSEMKIPSQMLHQIKQSAQVKYIETVLRNKNTSRDDFIFYSDRLVRLLIEEAINFIPFKDQDIVTPVGQHYSGSVLDSKVCGVSLMRAGDAMLKGLQSVLKDPLMGTLLIQSDLQKGPRLFFYRLPPEDLSNYYVMLLDATLGSGNTILMAIRLLIDHNVPEERIILVTILACVVGISRVANRYPKVNIVFAMLDKDLDEKGRILPGIGHFGDRYYGTETGEDREESD